jgi:hypothetical protein
MVSQHFCAFLAIDGVMIGDGDEINMSAARLFKYLLQGHSTIGTVFGMYMKINFHIQ